MRKIEAVLPIAEGARLGEATPHKIEMRVGIEPVISYARM